MRGRGIVKWWNNKQGWGFISRPGERDLFVRHDRICGDGFKELHNGDEVEFEIRDGARGPYAANVARSCVSGRAAADEPSRRAAS